MIKTTNQKGQMIVEAILIMVIFLGVSRYVAGQFKENELIKKLVRSPWTHLQSMIECGTWDTDMNTARQNHPAYRNRHVSLEGDPPN